MRFIQNPTSFEKKVLALVQGFQADFPPSKTEVMLGGTKLTMAELHRRLEEMLEVFVAVDQARLKHRDAVAARRDGMPGFRGLYADIILFVRQQFGRESVHLRTYGIALPTSRRKTVEQTLIASAKAAATRARRRASAAAAEEAGGE